MQISSGFKSQSLIAEQNDHTKGWKRRGAERQIGHSTPYIGRGQELGSAKFMGDVGMRSTICVLSFFVGLCCCYVSAQTITTVAGDGTYGYSGDGGPATSASVYCPAGVAVDASGNVFVADPTNSVIRKVSTNGVITTVAGNGLYGFSGDGGPATAARLFRPSGVTVDAFGNVFIADTFNNRIRKVSRGGIIATVAGNGTGTFSGDGGMATSASLLRPKGVAIDAGGNVFIADTGNGRIRRVSNAGIITTIAGGGTAMVGDGGLATAASLASGTAVAVDGVGNVYIADQFRIRMVSPNGIIATVAGNGTEGNSGDGGPAAQSSLYGPSGVTVDASGDVFIADTNNNRIRKVSGANGVITTVAGNGVYGFSGDSGPATSASLSHPSGVAVDAAGDLFIADTNNTRVRKVSASPSDSSGPSIASGGGAPAGTVSTIQPGGWVSIYGTNLAGSTVNWNRDFPTTLGGTSVTINGKPAYLGFVSPNQINLQAPDDNSTGPVEVVVTTASGKASSTVKLDAFAPSFFVIDNKHVAGIIVRSDGSGAYGEGTYDIMGPTGTSLGFRTVAGKAGDIVELFGTGFGPTSPSVPAGREVSQAAPTTNPVHVFINNVSVTAMFAGLSGAGLYQINLTIPAGLGTGDVPLLATVGGVQTSPVIISLRHDDK